MKNKTEDLNNHLFDQIERLSKEGLKGSELESEIDRTAAMVSISDRIIANADLNLKAARLIADHGDRVKKSIPLISYAGAE